LKSSNEKCVAWVQEINKNTESQVHESLLSGVNKRKNEIVGDIQYEAKVLKELRISGANVNNNSEESDNNAKPNVERAWRDRTELKNLHVFYQSPNMNINSEASDNSKIKNPNVERACGDEPRNPFYLLRRLIGVLKFASMKMKVVAGGVMKIELKSPQNLVKNIKTNGQGILKRLADSTKSLFKNTVSAVKNYFGLLPGLYDGETVYGLMIGDRNIGPFATVRHRSDRNFYFNSVGMQQFMKNGGVSFDYFIHIIISYLKKMIYNS
jgi:hypothetical protein